MTLGPIITFEEAAAQLAILQLVARYSHAIDHHDWDLLRSCFGTHSELVYGQYRGNLEGFIDYASTGLSAMVRHSHQMGQSLILLDGRTARAETYATCVHRYTTPDGRLEDLVVGARYIDRLQNGEAAGWVIQRRTMVSDWTRVDPVARTMPADEVISGTTDHNDPWYLDEIPHSV